MQYDQKKKKRLIYLGIAAFILLLLIIISTSTKKNSIDVLPDEGSSVDYSDKSVIKNAGNLLKSLGSVARYDLLRKDLYYFGKNSYGNYKKDKAVIGFEVTTTIKKSGSTISFEGHYGASKNKVSVVVKTLDNFRINTSITDTKTKKDLNNSLPSNNKRNKFIATLPDNQEGYSITYDSQSNSFIINLYDGTTERLEEAGDYLATKLGIKDLSKEKVNFIRTGDLTEESSVVPLPDPEDD